MLEENEPNYKMPVAVAKINHATIINVNHYLQAATANNTRKAYRQDLKHFMQWGGILPSSPEQILLYLQAFAAILNPRTLVRRMTALRNWHLYQGFTDPTSYPLIKKTLSGILNVHGRPREQAAALSLDQLKQMIHFIKSQNTLASWRNNALLQLGFFGALRCSEIINLKVADLNFVPEGLDLLIPRSKTDQIGEGQQCAIPYGDEQLCPVNALKTWLEKAHLTKGFIFCKINKHHNLSLEPLSHTGINLIIKKIAEACQLTNASQFSSHSLRRGFATTASRRGAPFASIMRHGRWRHEGTVLGYIEEGQRFETNAAKIILKTDLPRSGSQ